MNTTLNQNETELGILILPVPLQMLPNLHGLLDQHVQILWNFRCEAVGLEDTDNLLSSDGLDLCNAVGITEDDTDLGGGETLLGEFANVFLNVGGGDFEPRWWGAFVGEGTFGDTLSWCVHASHAVERYK